MKKKKKKKHEVRSLLLGLTNSKLKSQILSLPPRSPIIGGSSPIFFYFHFLQQFFHRLPKALGNLLFADGFPKIYTRPGVSAVFLAKIINIDGGAVLSFNFFTSLNTIKTKIWVINLVYLFSALRFFLIWESYCWLVQDEHFKKPSDHLILLLKNLKKNFFLYLRWEGGRGYEIKP